MTGNFNTDSKLLFPVLSISNKETWELSLSTFLYLPFFNSDCIHYIWLHSAMNLLTLILWFMLDVVAVNVNVHLTTACWRIALAHTSRIAGTCVLAFVGFYFSSVFWSLLLLPFVFFSLLPPVYTANITMDNVPSTNAFAFYQGAHVICEWRQVKV